MFLANFLIALREGVEASLIVGILVAYVVRTDRRDLLPGLWTGVVLAAAVPLGLGAMMTWGPYTLSFQAQEVLGGVLSLVAVALVTWMIFWMGEHSREYTSRLKADAEQKMSSGSDWGVVWIAVVAVGREGIETALFVWATVKSSASDSVAAPALGVLVGLLTAVVIGWLVYTGAARVNLRTFFTATGVLLILVAAGIVSYGIGDLQEASVLPGWGVPLYDVSHLVDGSLAPWLTTTSWWFTLLEAMFNLNVAPTALQVLGWCLYLAVVLPLFVRSSRGGHVHGARPAADAGTGTGVPDGPRPAAPRSDAVIRPVLPGSTVES